VALKYLVVAPPTVAAGRHDARSGPPGARTWKLPDPTAEARAEPDLSLASEVGQAEVNDGGSAGEFGVELCELVLGG